MKVSVYDRIIKIENKFQFSQNLMLLGLKLQIFHHHLFISPAFKEYFYEKQSCVVYICTITSVIDSITIHFTHYIGIYFRSLTIRIPTEQIFCLFTVARFFKKRH